jgi:N-acetylglucosaminyldiphosphoundecaprenol N-acetyl-beta-D-mannosaminyltransferase
MSANKKSTKSPLSGHIIPYANVLGVKVHLSTKNTIKKAIFSWFSYNKQYQISTPNPEQVILAQTNKAFRQALNDSDLCIPDGIGLVWAVNRQLKEKKIRRITGVDLTLELCEEAEKRNWRVFLLGGKTAVAQKAAAQLKKNHPKLEVEWDKGAKNIRKETAAENKEVEEKINKFKPHMLFVAYGAPFQELWLAKNLPNLKIKVGMSVGGTLDYIAGTVKRPPAWARRIGLEWFYRLIVQPWRIKRQLRLIKFIYLVLFK